MIEAWHLPLLFGTGFVAGFVDSVAGGGGLITVPVLLSFGLEPRDALGANKLQATFGSGSATWHYARGRAVDLSECGRGFVVTFLAAAAGAWLVQILPQDVLTWLIPFLLIAVAIYSLLRPNLGHFDLEPRMSRPRFDLLFGLLIGFYDGFFGPGTGTFWAMAFVLVMGFNFTKATANTKVMNFASNVGSLLVFLVGGHVLPMLVPGVVMGLGQLLGARIGSRTVIKHGVRFIRPVFISVVLALTLKLLYDAYAG
ncbi:MAG TPA: TSUP family transporter [Verrucomicrobia bacterium]|nr:TSUP family transporter [Verrucomicrobiota bacterium]HOP97383.1 TSUP family transporter [Verrucomicrobiota bacterium]HPU56777.1 TSUP family transporter [Verrucomicrobiota bacterium]